MQGKRCLGLLVFSALALLLSACAARQTTPAATPTAQPAGALIRYRGKFFSTAGECGYCHTGMKDAGGADISIDADWRSSMMANAARDPYYRAAVRSEVLANPQQQPAIEKKCAVCHVGMAFTTSRLDEEQIVLLPAEGFLSKDHPLHPLAVDGVSCTMCHQILGDNLQTPESNSGGYAVDETTPQGERDIHGRFTVDEALANIMANASGFVPVQVDYVQKSEICAVCHNLFTPYIDNQGQFSVEMFPEQTPQLEWMYSSFNDSKSCQSCHMPEAEGATFIANTGGPAREPFFQHQFVGANVYMVNLLKANPEELEVSAEATHFDATAAETLINLKERTATLDVKSSTQADVVFIDVAVQPLTGHKFPTSYPSRRAWLHLTLKDAQGKVIFESGSYDQSGAIVANDNDQDAKRYEPHYDLITSPDQVQIYETIIGDPNGEVTTALLRAKTYLKDNRLLPAGFDKQTVPADIAVMGEAFQDDDFLAGADTVHYRTDLSAYQGPFTAHIELLYQSIGYRWAEKFKTEDNPEGVEFYSYAARHPNLPVVVASASIEIP